MSFVVAAPEFVHAAAQDLAATRSTLTAAFASAAPATTAVLAAADDEISTGVAALFGNFGQQYQALGARAAAFHEQFVSLLNAGAGAYLSTETANASATASLATIAGPYETLFANTATNLQALGTVLSANPVPFLHQFINNQTGYLQTIAAEIEYVIQNLPAVLANLPANIQAAIQAFLAFDPLPYLQEFLKNQLAYAQLVGMSLQNAADHFVAGLQALPAAFQSAFQALQAGDIGGAVSDIAQGFVNLFVTGVDTTTTGSLITPPGLMASVVPTGTLGDLLPILTIPGMAAQNLTNLLPPGSIPAQISQNVTNLIDTVTNTSITATVLLQIRVFPPSVNFALANTFGLPVALLFEAVGGPINALNAASSSVTAFTTAVQTGNTAGAIGALVDAPAVVADGFLNGESILPVEFDVSGYPTVVNLPLDGILVPVTPYTASINLGFPLGTITVVDNGTPLSGLATGLLNYLPEQLAAAIAP